MGGRAPNRVSLCRLRLLRSFAMFSLLKGPCAQSRQEPKLRRQNSSSGPQLLPTSEMMPVVLSWRQTASGKRRRSAPEQDLVRQRTSRKASMTRPPLSWVPCFCKQRGFYHVGVSSFFLQQSGGSFGSRLQLVGSRLAALRRGVQWRRQMGGLFPALLAAVGVHGRTRRIRGRR